MRRRILYLLALLWFAAIAIAVIPLLDRPVDDGQLEATPLPASECPGLELGVHSTLAYEDDASRREATVAAIHGTLGAQVVRDSLLWNRIEPVEGQLDWSSSDGAVEDLRAAGIEPELVVLGSPSWANGVPESTPEQYLYVPSRGPRLEHWLAEYADFLRAAVDRYKGVVRRWEIWNEPNLVHFWHPQPDPVAYRHVYEVLRRSILRVDPNAEVAVGGITSLTLANPDEVAGLEFLRRFLRTDPPIDNLAVHLYTTDDHPPDVHVPGENNFDDVERVHEQLVAAGEPAPIWVTEFGWSSADIGEDLQARYVDRALEMLERRYPFVRLATYFSDHDRPPRFFQGLLHEDLTAKPAASVFKSRARQASARCDRSR